MHLTIVMPTYKRPKGLMKSLESIKGNTYKDLSVIIVCEKEDKETYSWFYDLNKRIPYPLIFLSNPKNMGLTSAFNHGFKIASFADAVLWAGDDTEFWPDCISKAMATLKEKFPDGDGFIGFNQMQEGRTKGRSYAFGLVGKKFLNRYPENAAFCPDYIHYGVDKEVGHYSISLDRFFVCRDAKINHIRLQDETAEYSRRFFMRDKDIFRKRQEKQYLWGKNFNLIGDE